MLEQISTKAVGRLRLAAFLAACLCAGSLCLLLADGSSHRESLAQGIQGSPAAFALSRLQLLHDSVSGEKNAKLRHALKQLEGNLEGELQSIRGILGSLQQAHTSAQSDTASPDHEERKESVPGQHNEQENDMDEKWTKKEMQRGALRGESVQDQLRKALEHSMDELIKQKTRWHSSEDLDNAQKVADYIRSHPLPTPDDTEGSGASRRETEDDRQSRSKDSYDDQKSNDDQRSARPEQREKSRLTVQDYRDLVKVLQEAVAMEERGGQEDAQRTAVAPVHAKPTSEQSSQSAPHDSHAEFNPIAAASRVRYAAQVGDRVIDLAAKNGRTWVDHEILREHGNFVRLPNKDWEPLPVQPYYQNR